MLQASLQTTPYTLQRGDTLTSVARSFGLPSWRAMYNHPANADFRARRPDPNRVRAGDVIHIPGDQTGRQPDYVVPGMRLVQQAMGMSCWYASARMLIQWRRRRRGQTEIVHPDPSEDAVSAAMRASDNGITNSQIVAFAKRLGLRTVPAMSPTSDALERWLRTHGPLWVNGTQHITVLAGIRADRVLIYDPARSAPEWRTLSAWYAGSRFDARDTSADVTFLYLP